MLDDTLNLSTYDDQVIQKKGKKQKDYVSIEQLLKEIDKSEASETKVKKLRLRKQKSSPNVSSVLTEESPRREQPPPPLIKLTNLVLHDRSPSKAYSNHMTNYNQDFSPEAIYHNHQPAQFSNRDRNSFLIRPQLVRGPSKGSFREDRTFNSASQPRFSNNALNPSNSDINYLLNQTPSSNQLLPRISKVYHDHSPSIVLTGEGTNRSSFNNAVGSFQSRVLRINEGDMSPENQQILKLNINSERVRHSSLQRSHQSMKVNLPKLMLQENSAQFSPGLISTPDQQKIFANQGMPQTQARAINRRRTDRAGGYLSTDMSAGARSCIKLSSVQRPFDFLPAANNTDFSADHNTPRPLIPNLGNDSTFRPSFHKKSLTRDFANVSESGTTQAESSFKLERHLSDQQMRLERQSSDEKSKFSRAEFRTSIFRKIAQNTVLKAPSQ